MKKSLYITILLLSFIRLDAKQSFEEFGVIDSLQLALQSTDNDSMQIFVLNELCLEYKSNFPGKALEYGKKL
ncbi:MAG: hypothetical protein ABII90_16070 [Bacteroidota bacterium]